MVRNGIVNHNFLQMVVGNASIKSIKLRIWKIGWETSLDFGWHIQPLQMAQFGISRYNDGTAPD